MKIDRKIVGYAVAKPTDPPPQTTGPAPASTNLIDRRMVLTDISGDGLGINLDKRPQNITGHEGITYRIDAPGERVYVIVNHVGRNPFEVFIRARKSRGLESLAQTLSMDLRSFDRKFIRLKLEALSRVTDTPFDFQMPDGIQYRMRGVLSCIARLILYRCEQLWEGTDAGNTPLHDAMAVKREPKTTTDGTLSWTVNVENQATGDDFKLFIAEASSNGEARAYSVSIDGDFEDETYRQTLRGTCKSLSIDLLVGPLEWAGKKLRQLLEYAEPRAEFRARIPGSEKTAFYPSTEAYVADLVLYRLATLGLLHRDGRPLLTAPALTLVPAVVPEPVMQGKLCGECGAYAVIKVDGCDTCKSCGNSKCG